jgi:hypothetical protein
MTYLLDTCVISEYVKKQPCQQVINWIDTVVPNAPFLICLIILYRPAMILPIIRFTPLPRSSYTYIKSLLIAILLKTGKNSDSPTPLNKHG